MKLYKKKQKDLFSLLVTSLKQAKKIANGEMESAKAFSKKPKGKKKKS